MLVLHSSSLSQLWLRFLREKLCLKPRTVSPQQELVNKVLAEKLKLSGIEKKKNQRRTSAETEPAVFFPRFRKCWEWWRRMEMCKCLGFFFSCVSVNVFLGVGWVCNGHRFGEVKDLKTCGGKKYWGWVWRWEKRIVLPWAASYLGPLPRLCQA